MSEKYCSKEFPSSSIEAETPSKLTWLPGFQPDSKLQMFQKISDSIEIVIVISATDIEKNKLRADLGITYDEDVLRLRGEFQNRGFLVGSVVITHYNGQPAAAAFKQRL